MSQRLIAAFVALPLMLALFVYALVGRVPYAAESPGGTINVLGQNENGARIVQVVGHQVYPDDGDLRMTFISVTPASPPDQPTQDWLSLPGALEKWFDPDVAVLPYDVVHPDQQTPKQSKEEGAQQMNTSQDDAIAVALTELGYDVPNAPKVVSVTPGSPAEGQLEANDVITSVNGSKLQGDTAEAKLKQLSTTIAATPDGGAVDLDILRGGVEKKVSIKPRLIDNKLRVGIELGVGYQFPFSISVNINPDIGGPSAGLMFSLAIFDTLTPGSMTDGHNVAGTGEILPDGSVGPIGGIQQKIVTARDDGVELYFVPAQNCADASGADAGGMRLVKATSMHEAREALATWVADPEAALPSCSSSAEARS